MQSWTLRIHSVSRDSERNLADPASANGNTRNVEKSAVPEHGRTLRLSLPDNAYAIARKLGRVVLNANRDQCSSLQGRSVAGKVDDEGAQPRNAGKIREEVGDVVVCTEDMFVGRHECGEILEEVCKTLGLAGQGGLHCCLEKRTHPSKSSNPPGIEGQAALASIASRCIEAGLLFRRWSKFPASARFRTYHNGKATDLRRSSQRGRRGAHGTPHRHRQPRGMGCPQTTIPHAPVQGMGERDGILAAPPGTATEGRMVASHTCNLLSQSALTILVPLA